MWFSCGGFKRPFLRNYRMVVGNSFSAYVWVRNNSWLVMKTAAPLSGLSRDQAQHWRFPGLRG